MDVGAGSYGPPLHQPPQKWQMRQLTLMVEQKLREDEEAELELQGLGATGGERTGGNRWKMSGRWFVSLLVSKNTEVVM